MQRQKLYLNICPLGWNSTYTHTHEALKLFFNASVGVGMPLCIKGFLRGLIGQYWKTVKASISTVLITLKKLTKTNTKNYPKFYPKFPIGVFRCKYWCKTTTRISK